KAPAGVRIALQAHGRWSPMQTRAGSRTFALVGSVLATIGFLGGCVFRKETPPAASPATTVVVTTPQRTVNYPEGRYELYGDGKTTPYYWVWVRAGAAAAPTPPLPPRY